MTSKITPSKGSFVGAIVLGLLMLGFGVQTMTEAVSGSGSLFLGSILGLLMIAVGFVSLVIFPSSYIRFGEDQITKGNLLHKSTLTLKEVKDIEFQRHPKMGNMTKIIIHKIEGEIFELSATLFEDNGMNEILEFLRNYFKEPDEINSGL